VVEDHDSERLTDVVDAVVPPRAYGDGVGDGFGDDDPIGMRVGPGLEVGGYVIDGELGHGGMGVVYSATHPVIGKRAAIKILRPEVSRSPVAVERFIQEARAVNQIGHPNIVDIFAYGALPDGRAYHVMDLLVGESLRRRLKRDVLHPSEAASVIDEIAQALSAAHEHGFVHRDLKPDNVFLVSHESRWPEVKLLDFGLAKLMPEHGVAAVTTKTGVMLGTPEYMSPEQARGIGVDYRTDVYALGIVMFEILAGARPFPPLGDPLATLLQHAEEPPTSLSDVISGLPDEMVQLVAAMLAKTPEARPSLAAVRTVIKRLRTTQLPTRSVAGLAVSSYSKLPAQPLGVTPSYVGAQVMLPGDLRTSGLAPQPMTTPGLGLDSLRSNLSLHTGGTSNPLLSSSYPGGATNPLLSSSSTGTHPTRPRAASQHPPLTSSQPGGMRATPTSAPPALHSSSVGSQPLARALDGSRDPRLPHTTLGVAAPVLRPPAPVPPEEARGPRMWLVIVVLLLAAATVASIIALS